MPVPVLLKKCKNVLFKRKRVIWSLLYAQPYSIRNATMNYVNMVIMKFISLTERRMIQQLLTMLCIMCYGIRIIEYVKTLKNSAQFECWGSESFPEEDIY